MMNKKENYNTDPAGKSVLHLDERIYAGLSEDTEAEFEWEDEVEEMRTNVVPDPQKEEPPYHPL